jgi:hypothetical protein
LVVTVVNVFGSWLGDFVDPAHQKQTHTASTGGSSNQNNNSNSTSSVTITNNDGTSTVAGAKGEAILNSAASSTSHLSNKKNTNILGTIQGDDTQGTNQHDATVAKSVGQDGSAAVANKTITLNLAWILLLIPMAGIAFLAKRSFVPARALALRGIHLFL